MLQDVNETIIMDKKLSSRDLKSIVAAVMQVYPMIVLANLSKNQYTMLRDEGFLCRDIETCGRYDDMIDDGVENIHTNYQRLFLECFSRENIIRNFASGKNEVYAELYQKDKTGEYHWVSVHAIKIEDDSGDIMQICLNRILDKVSINGYGQRK